MTTYTKAEQKIIEQLNALAREYEDARTALALAQKRFNSAREAFHIAMRDETNNELYYTQHLRR